MKRRRKISPSELDVASLTAMPDATLKRVIRVFTADLRRTNPSSPRSGELLRALWLVEKEYVRRHPVNAAQAGSPTKRTRAVRVAEASALEARARAERSEWGTGMKTSRSDELFGRSGPAVLGGAPGSSKKR
jgi:hypothetical protein